MKILFDTHALLWWSLNELPRIPARAVSAIRDRDNELLVSSASAWEIATKFRIGKLPEARSFIDDFDGVVRRTGALHLATTWSHALLAGTLPGPHNDPFDRLLIAQARLENATVISGDPVFGRYRVATIW
jgi:PIN domain nuclease of toxin-antitoxin system